MIQKLTVDPITPLLGAEISGIDVSSSGDSVFEFLYRAWLEHKIIVIRNQQLDMEALQSFSRCFGVLMRLPYIVPLDNYPYIIRVLKRADEIDMGTFGGDWHPDFSFFEAPPKGSILYAEEIPPVGGDTLWVDMVQALEKLPGEMRENLRGKIAIYSGKPYGVKHAPSEDSQFRGSIVIWDNRNTLHYAVNVYDGYRRCQYRTTIRGQRPVPAM